MTLFVTVLADPSPLHAVRQIFAVEGDESNFNDKWYCKKAFGITSKPLFLFKIESSKHFLYETSSNVRGYAFSNWLSNSPFLSSKLRRELNQLFW
jgi:hypothetical protein